MLTSLLFSGLEKDKFIEGFDGMFHTPTFLGGVSLRGTLFGIHIHINVL